MPTNLPKNTATAKVRAYRSGEGYPYDSALTYEGNDIYDREVAYDYIGTATTPRNLSKNASSPSNLAKS